MFEDRIGRHSTTGGIPGRTFPSLYESSVPSLDYVPDPRDANDAPAQLLQSCPVSKAYRTVDARSVMASGGCASFATSRNYRPFAAQPPGFFKGGRKRGGSQNPN